MVPYFIACFPLEKDSLYGCKDGGIFERTICQNLTLINIQISHSLVNLPISLVGWVGVGKQRVSIHHRKTRPLMSYH